MRWQGAGLTQVRPAKVSSPAGRRRLTGVMDSGALGTLIVTFKALRTVEGRLSLAAV